jgi:hypothetical protein
MASFFGYVITIGCDGQIALAIPGKEWELNKTVPEA